MNKREIVITDSIDPNVWDAKAIHPMQSYAWGEARKEMGTEVCRVAVFEDDVFVAGYQMTIHPLPHLPYAIAYIPRSGVPDADVCQFLRRYGASRRIVFIKWEPYVTQKESEGLASLMHVSSHGLFTEWNLEVDLSSSEEEILARCTKNTRYAIRQAEKKGVVVSEVSTDAGFETFLDLYFQTCARQKYHGHTKAFHRMIWKHLHKAGIAKIYIASYSGKPHTAFQVYYWQDRAFYPHSGNSGEDRSVSAGQLLMWHVIRDAKQAQKHVMDLWGALPPKHSVKHPWAGFTFFKKSFGAEYVHMSPSYDLVIHRTLYILYGIAYFVRKILLLWKR